MLTIESVNLWIHKLSTTIFDKEYIIKEGIEKNIDYNLIINKNFIPDFMSPDISDCNYFENRYGPLQHFLYSEQVKEFLQSIGYICGNFLFLDLGATNEDKKAFFPFLKYPKDSITMPIVADKTKIEEAFNYLNNGVNTISLPDNEYELGKLFYSVLEKLTPTGMEAIIEQANNIKNPVSDLTSESSIFKYRINDFQDRTETECASPEVSDTEGFPQLINFLNILGVKYTIQFLIPETIYKDSKEKDNKFIALTYMNFNKNLNDSQINKVISLIHYLTPPSIGKAYRNIIRERVLFHSTSAAVAAIISRNHSHHIGSHVTPRTSVNIIRKRYETICGQICGFEVLHEMRECFDEYVQKKAEFIAEIATSPLVTTTTKHLFSEVLSRFLHNPLIMDNIGANESVNFSKNAQNIWENRIKFHFRVNEVKVTIKYSNGSYTNANLPYGACNFEPIIDFKDLAISWPGPLGEYALYSFLENFLRNSIKHNTELQKKDRDLNIFIELSVIEENNDYFKIEVWDDVTNPEKVIRSDEKLFKFLNDFIKKPIVKNDGSLRHEAWGIAEMKIMATLLLGSKNFMSMHENLIALSKEKDGKKVLVYEFKVMKSREIVIISSSPPDDASYFNTNGIYHFSTFDKFKQFYQTSASIAGFQIAILDKDSVQNYSKYSNLLPYRLIIESASVNGCVQKSAAKEDNNFITKLFTKTPDELIKCAWDTWGKFLLEKTEQSGASLILYLGHTKELHPTKEWLEEIVPETRDVGIIFKSSNGLMTSTNSCIFNDHYFPKFVFDRHCDACRNGDFKIIYEDSIKFHEILDKNSVDFIPILLTTPKKRNIWPLMESACLRILIIDERVTETAYKQICQSENGKTVGLYKSRDRLIVAKRANIYIATHLFLDKKLIHLHSEAEDNAEEAKKDRICVQIKTLNGNPSIETYYCVDRNDNSCDECTSVKEKIILDSLIIHQGVAESNRFLRQTIHPDESEGTFLESFKSFLDNIKTEIPYIAVDSGRGIPSELPEVKFIPFSLVEDSLMRDRISKFTLANILMNLIHRK